MYIGSVLYLLGVLPTGVFLLGLWTSVGQAIVFRRSRTATKDASPNRSRDREGAVVADPPRDHRSLTVAAPIGRFVCVLLMLFTGLMFVPAVVKYHVWSIVQARYLFAAMFGCLVTFGAGVEIVQRHRGGRIALAACMAALTATFLFYFAVEIAHWSENPYTKPRR